MGNKVKFGLKKVHYAVITETDGVLTYGAPMPLVGAVSLSVSPKGNKSEFYADDMPYFSGSVNQGYEGTLEVALLPDEFKLSVLGYKKDENNVLFEDANATSKNIALLFEFSGDVHATRHAFLNVTVERAGIASGTKNTTIEVKSDTFSITANPVIESGLVKAKAEQESAGYETWFTTVYTYTNII